MLYKLLNLSVPVPAPCSPEKPGSKSVYTFVLSGLVSAPLNLEKRGLSVKVSSLKPWKHVHKTELYNNVFECVTFECRWLPDKKDQ